MSADSTNEKHEAECPCRNCTLVADGYEQVDLLFGYRDMGDGRKNPVRPQSYCRKCRSAKCTADKPRCT